MKLQLVKNGKKICLEFHMCSKCVNYISHEIINFLYYKIFSQYFKLCENCEEDFYQTLEKHSSSEKDDEFTAEGNKKE